MSQMAIGLMLLGIKNEEERRFITQIYLDYRKLMYAVAMEIVRDSGIAEDMISASLIEMMEQIDALQKINCCNLTSYVASIVRNNSLDYIRKRDRRQTKFFLPKDEDALNQAASPENVEEAFLLRAEIAELRAAIERLSPEERMLLTMKYLDGMGDREIAGVLGVAKDSVRTYLSRARRRLRKIMEGKEHE